MAHRPVGVGHLTMLDVSPPEWVALAAEAGFEAVGIRVGVASPTEEPWPISVGSPTLAETLRRLDDTGLVVQDVEIIRLTPDTRPKEHRPLFETGAELGARFFNVMVDDPDLGHAHDIFAELAEEALALGLRPSMEGMAYTKVASLDDAIAVLAGSGGGLIIDPLHLQRCGDTVEQVRGLDSTLISYFQACDAPLAIPAGLPRPNRLPRGQSADVGDAQFEARAARLLPGDGDLPLREILEALPPGLPLSVEAPNLALREQLGPLEFLRRARRSVAQLVEG